MEKEKLKTDDFVILIDAGYLEEIGHSMRDYFSHIVKRNLPKADMPALIEGIALDSGIRPADNKIQVIFVYPKSLNKFSFCEPSDLTGDLHCVAFKSNVGEFSFTSYSTEGLVSHEELYGEFIDALTVSQNTKVVMLVGNMPSYNKESVKQLQEVTDREVYYFNMNPQESQQYVFKYNNLGYVLLHAMGIKPEELE